MKFKTHTIDGNEYYPLRAISEKLEYKVDYFDNIEYFNNLCRNENTSVNVIDKFASEHIDYDEKSALNLAVEMFDEIYSQHPVRTKRR